MRSAPEVNATFACAIVEHGASRITMKDPASEITSRVDSRKENKRRDNSVGGGHSAMTDQGRVTASDEQQIDEKRKKNQGMPNKELQKKLVYAHMCVNLSLSLIVQSSRTQILSQLFRGDAARWENPAILGQKLLSRNPPMRATR